MMRTKPKLIKQRDDFFKDQFNRFFSDWKKQDPKKNTQKEFARQICEIRKKKTGEKCPVTNTYISEWKRGIWFPEMYLPEIAEVLGVSVEEFTPSTHDQLYQYESAYQTELGKRHIAFSNDIGLNLNFVNGLKKVVDFDHTFPVYTPIVHRTPDPEEPFKFNYDRDLPLAKSAPIDKELDFLQINHNGKLITLHKADLAFLKEVQDQIVEYVEFLFYKRKKEMKEEEKRFNDDMYIKIKGGGTATVRIDDQYRMDHDRFYKYVLNDQKIGKDAIPISEFWDWWNSKKKEGES